MLLKQNFKPQKLLINAKLESSEILSLPNQDPIFCLNFKNAKGT